MAYVGNHSVKLVALGDYNSANSHGGRDSTVTIFPRRPQPPGATFDSFAAPDSGFRLRAGFVQRRLCQLPRACRSNSNGVSTTASTCSILSLGRRQWTTSRAILEVQQGDNSRLNMRNIGTANAGRRITISRSTIRPAWSTTSRSARDEVCESLDRARLHHWRMACDAHQHANSGLPVNLTYGAVAGFSVGGRRRRGLT